MFHVAPWNSLYGSSLDLESILIWAHMKGVPLDLMHTEGLSLIAGLIGDPKEINDYTLNLVSISTAYVKVEADVAKPLPSEVDLERQDGLVILVQVEYSWLSLLALTVKPYDMC